MTVAYSGLLDLNMVERLGRSLTDLEPSSALAFALDFLGDTAALEKLLHDPDVEPPVAAWIVPRLGLDDEAARAELKKLVLASPDAWSVRSTFAEYLEARGAFADERALALDWLARNGKNEGLTPIVAKTLIARTYYLEKNYAAGWKTIEPILPSQFGGAMMRGAYLLSALGKKDQAEELAKARLDRYKNLESLALLLELYWHHGKLAEAGALVVHPPVDASHFQWRIVVGKAFAGEFASRPLFDGVAAFGTMKAADPHVLREIATAVNLANNHDLAFNLEQPLGVPGMENLEFLLRTAAFLEESKGHSAALTWLKPRVPANMLEPLSQFAFGAKMDPLLWELVPTPAADRTDEAVGWVWLFRAAASLRTPSDPHAPEIARYYEGAGNSRADVIGRYLLGKADESAVIALATDDKSACEVAFWLGYKAQTDKRYADASDWYRTAVESTLTQVYEYRQAYDQLQAWHAKGKALKSM